MAPKCLNATLQWMYLQAYKAILTHWVIFIAATCLQSEQIVRFWECYPLTPTINISTEHEGRGDTIKTLLEGFDPKPAGALVVAGAFQQNRGIPYMCGNMVQKSVIVVEWAWWGQAHPHAKALVWENKGKSYIIYFILTYKLVTQDFPHSSYVIVTPIFIFLKA